MKKKILFIIVIIVVLVILGIGIFIGIKNKNKTPDIFNYKIPNNYISIISDDKSNVDGANTNYYIYKDKIIVEIINNYPVGHPEGTMTRTVTEYKNIDTKNANDLITVKKIIKDKKGWTHVKDGVGLN